ncbi:MAG: hypothetical protein V1850_03935 [Candidatus Bathyarchaeota archaeon]
MKAYLKKNFSKGFFLTEEGMVKLADICRKRMADQKLADSLCYKVFRSDSLVYETKDHPEIIREENSQRNRITHLQFSCTHDQLQFGLDFDKKDGVAITIECSDKDFGYLLFSDLKEYLNTEVLKFRGMTFDNMVSNRLVIVVLILLMILLTLFWAKKPDLDANSLSTLLASESTVEKLNYLVKRANDTGLSWYSRVIPFIPMGVLILMLFLGPILDKMYPRNIFYWGKEITHYDRVVNTRSKVVWSVLIAFIISAVASLAVYYMTTK